MGYDTNLLSCMTSRNIVISLCDEIVDIYIGSLSIRRFTKVSTVGVFTLPFYLGSILTWQCILHKINVDKLFNFYHSHGEVSMAIFPNFTAKISKVSSHTTTHLLFCLVHPKTWESINPWYYLRPHCGLKLKETIP